MASDDRVPAPIPKTLECNRCGVQPIETYWLTLSDGREQHGANCAKCGRFIQWLKQFCS